MSEESRRRFQEAARPLAEAAEKQIKWIHFLKSHPELGEKPRCSVRGWLKNHAS